MNNVAYCGLACCVCSENDKCVGCQNGGCDIHGWCKNYNCCREKGLNGCWECADFPCEGGMLNKPRIRAFALFAKEYGVEELTKCLLLNKENGIIYHYEGQLIGDYDKCETEEEIIMMIKHNSTSVKQHYDLLIDENNDPVLDPKEAQSYMDNWDGQAFIDEMELSLQKSVLEIGVGTGRLALKVVENCKRFTGIDISPKTIKRANKHLEKYNNKTLICNDFFNYDFNEKFDVIYCSLTLWHIKDKQIFINKVCDLLNDGGRFVLSIGNDQSTQADFGNRKITMYPDSVDDTTKYLINAKLDIKAIKNVEFGNVFVAIKR